jgi:hypothetical protein
MNERIEALAKQAAEYAIEFAVKDQELYIPKLMEKFAELIVRECARKVDWILAEGGKTQGDLIKEHFGVEE